MKGAPLRADDVVEHLFVTTTHHWLLFFTEHRPGLPGEGVRGAGGEPRREGPARREPARAAARRGDRADPRHPRLRARRSTCVLATRGGLVKKTELTEYDTNRTGGIIAINLREGDEVVSAMLVEDEQRGAAGQPARAVDPFRARSDAAADGPLDLGRDRACTSATATSCCDASVVPVGGDEDDDRFVFVVDRGRLREAHPHPRVPAAGPRRSGHQGGQAERGARRPRRRPRSLARRTRSSWFLPAARWYARLSLRSRRRDETRWESCSPGSPRTIGSSPSRRNSERNLDNQELEGAAEEYGRR